MTFCWGLEMSAVSKQCECCFWGPSINNVNSFSWLDPSIPHKGRRHREKSFRRVLPNDMGPSIYYVSKGVVGVRKMAMFADVNCYLCWRRRVGGCVRKNPKMCWRNMMFPILNNLNFSYNRSFFPAMFGLSNSDLFDFVIPHIAIFFHYLSWFFSTMFYPYLS